MASRASNGGASLSRDRPTGRNRAHKRNSTDNQHEQQRSHHHHHHHHHHGHGHHGKKLTHRERKRLQMLQKEKDEEARRLSGKQVKINLPPERRVQTHTPEGRRYTPRERAQIVARHRELERARDDPFPPAFVVRRMPHRVVGEAEDVDEEEGAEEKKSGDDEPHAAGVAMKAAQVMQVGNARKQQQEARAAEQEKAEAEREKEPKDTVWGRFTPRYRALGWGWSGEGRTGTGNNKCELVPRDVNRAEGRTIVDVAAGKHHSLLLTDGGVLLSCGLGTSEQLGQGYKHYQWFPKQVFPTGRLNYHRDFLLAEAGAGAHFSIARECGPEEALSGSIRYAETQARLHELESESPDLAIWGILRSHMSHERFVQARRCKGRVFSWGYGRWGQLGHGYDVRFRRHPTLIRELEFYTVVQIACGDEHSLALIDTGVVFTWGRGSYGKLGHGDYKDRMYPTHLEYLDGVTVVRVAAGVHHSAAVTLSSTCIETDSDDGHNYNGDSVMDSTMAENDLYLFGRGGHGRLADPSNVNCFFPRRVRSWPPSFANTRITSVALGAAHNVVATVKPAPKTRANPWGQDTAVYTWGYGANGQLGRDTLEHSPDPVKVRIPRWERVVRVAAGKSHTLAVTVNGDVLAWGKNWVGELGLGHRKVCMAPRKLEPRVGHVVRISAGESHTMAVAISGKHNITKERIEGHSVMHDHAHLGLKPCTPAVLRVTTCCRRMPAAHISTRWRMFSCGTCNIEHICWHCARLDHREHELELLPDDMPRGLCEWGLDKRCSLPPLVLEVRGKTDKLPAVLRLQQFAREIAAKQKRSHDAKVLAFARYKTAQLWWDFDVDAQLKESMKQSDSEYSERRERFLMEQEERNHRLHIYYFKLQMALQGLDLLRQATWTVVAQTAVLDPPTMQRKRFSWSFAHARKLQMELRHIERTPRDKLVAACANFPTVDSREAWVADPDLQHFVQDVQNPKESIAFGLAAEAASVIRSSGSKKKRSRIRRRSVTDPAEVYNRMVLLRRRMLGRQQNLRRPSLPARVSDLVAWPHTVRHDPLKHEEIMVSLHLFENRTERMKISSRLTQPGFMLQKVGRKMLEGFRRGAWLLPRRPRDVREWRTGRRRTIADPERLNQQLRLMRNMRQMVGTVRHNARQVRYPCRRRSFDFREETDAHADLVLEGIEERLKDTQFGRDLQAKEFYKTMKTITARGRKLHLLPESESEEEEGDEDEEFEEDGSDAGDGEGEDNTDWSELLDATRPKASTAVQGKRMTKKKKKKKKTGPPDVWEERQDEYGNVYYYNPRRKESRWERPDPEPEQEEDETLEEKTESV